VNLQILSAALIGYGFGCIQPAYIFSKTIRNIDIRQHGSGNAGASNITTIMGLKYGVLVGLIDILKGMFAVMTVKWIFPGHPDLAYLSGLFAIIGHIFPFYMNFRGGKGVAALAGMMLGVDWRLGILFILLVAIPALLTDYIVSGSFTTFLALPIVTAVYGYPTVHIFISIFLTMLCFYLHRGNIQRIIKKEELKISKVIGKK